MAPEEICKKLGESKTKAIFAELKADGMKKVLRETGMSTTRSAGSASTRRRNEEWANRVWRTVNDKAGTALAATLLFEWLTRTRRTMLAEFLSGIDVKHDAGLTDADFMQTTPAEKLLEEGKRLLEKHNGSDAAAYLLFLDASNKSEIFGGLDLEKKLAS